MGICASAHTCCRVHVIVLEYEYLFVILYQAIVHHGMAYGFSRDWPCRWQPQEQLHVWVGGVRTDDGRKEVLYTLEVAGVQRPALLPVAGAPPGLLLRFASPLLVPPALVALRSRIGGPAPAAASATMPAMLAPPEVARALPRGPAADVGPRTLWVGQVREPAAYVPGGVLADVYTSCIHSAQP